MSNANRNENPETATEAPHPYKQKPGVYALFARIPNPGKDRRCRDWAHGTFFEPGVYVIHERPVIESDRGADGKRAYSVKYRQTIYRDDCSRLYAINEHNPAFPVLSANLLPIPEDETLSTLLAEFNSQSGIALQSLLDAGKITLGDVRAVLCADAAANYLRIQTRAEEENAEEAK